MIDGTGEPTVLRGERLTLRRATEADVPALAAILREPSVARWWNPDPGEADVRELLEIMWTVELEGAVAGFVMVDDDGDEDWTNVGFDMALTTTAQDQGHGPEALRVLIRHHVALGRHRFTIDPAVDNERAIRAYERVGFRPVGVLRRVERRHDGTWGDNLLMELLAEELAG